MKITNKLNLPEGFAKAVSAERHNRDGSLSATTLIQGVKQILLTERHWGELEDDVSDRVWAIWGQAVHSLLGHEGESDFAEQDMAHKVGNITVTGRIDNYDMEGGVICDYKTASVSKVKFNDFSDWRKQGLIYAWLLKKNGFEAKQCRFIALLKDHSKSEALRDRSYPQNPVRVFEFPVTLADLVKIDGFIKSRVREYERCRILSDDDIPPCAPEERWEKAPKYAVMKAGGKKAVRLLGGEAEAEAMASQLGAAHYVELRPGESTKCNGYCLCSQFCNFHCNALNLKEIKEVS